MVRRSSKKTSDSEAEVLLSSANKASEHLAVLHVAFMAVCAYVLVIVFGTTDLELLIGKDVKLPVIDVMMPIVGFYAVAPYIVALVHFNLLLQLQLLSRKLYAFDAAAPEENRIGGMRDRLHIFPFTYYLIGRPGRVVRTLMGIIVSFTLVFLPLITLFSLQIRFLSYQDEAITWFQRIAIYLDLLLVVILWPIILHKQDNWRSYWREVITAHIPRKQVWLAYAMFFTGIILFLFGASKLIFVIGFVLCLLAPFVLNFLYGWRQMPQPLLPRFLFLFLMIGILLLTILLTMIFKLNLPMNIGVPLIAGLLIIAALLALFWNPQAPHGSFALLLTLSLVPVLPLTLMVDGERLEKIVLYLQKNDADVTAVSESIFKIRRLELDEHALFAKPVKPETLAIIRSGNWQEGLKQVEPINLQGRSLRHAQMINTVLVGADLKGAQLQGANLWEAHLQGVNLFNVHLQGAFLLNAQLQGAYMGYAELQGAFLWEAHLQGVNLWGANLQGITGPLLSGELVDLRKAKLGPLTEKEVSKLISELTPINKEQKMLNEVIENLKQAAQPGTITPDFGSCLASANTPVKCKKHYDPEKPDELKEFTKGLNTFLTNLACVSSDIAKGILRQIRVEEKEGSLRIGLDAELKKRLQSNEPCPGLKGLSEKEKKKLLKVEKQ